MPYLTGGVAPVMPAFGVAVSPSRPSDSSFCPIESTFGGLFGQRVGRHDLIERQRLHVELFVGEPLHAIGTREMGVFGA